MTTQEEVQQNISAAGLTYQVITPIQLVGAGPAGSFVTGIVRIWAPSGRQMGDYQAASFVGSGGADYAQQLARQAQSNAYYLPGVTGAPQLPPSIAENPAYYGYTPEDVAAGRIATQAAQVPVQAAPTAPVVMQSPSTILLQSATQSAPLQTGVTPTTASAQSPTGIAPPPPPATGAASAAPQLGAIATTQPVVLLTGNVILDEIQKRASQDAFFVNGRGNYWHWNFYFEQVTGQKGPDPSEIGLTGDEDLSFSEYWGSLRGWSGLPASLKEAAPITAPGASRGVPGALPGASVWEMLKRFLAMLLAGQRPSSV